MDSEGLARLQSLTLTEQATAMLAMLGRSQSRLTLALISAEATVKDGKVHTDAVSMSAVAAILHVLDVLRKRAEHDPEFATAMDALGDWIAGRIAERPRVIPTTFLAASPAAN